MKLPVVKKALFVNIPASFFGIPTLKSSNNNWISSIAANWSHTGCGKNIMCWVRSHPNIVGDFLISGNDYSDKAMRQRDEWHVVESDMKKLFPSGFSSSHKKISNISVKDFSEMRRTINQL